MGHRYRLSVNLNVTAQLHGMAEADGRLGQDLALGRWPVPAVVQITPTDVIWDRSELDSYGVSVAPPGISHPHPRGSRPASRLLGDFLVLDLASDSSLHQFVSDYGPLVPAIGGALGMGFWGREPRALWAAFQHDLLKLWNWHVAGREGDPQNLRLVNHDVDLGPPDAHTMWPVELEPGRTGGTATGTSDLLRFSALTKIGGPRFDVGGEYINAILRARPAVLEYDTVLGVRSRATGLSTALALQLAQAFQGRGADGRDRALATCTACGQVIQTKRRPREGESTWCTSDDCQRAAARARQLRRRQRSRA